MKVGNVCRLNDKIYLIDFGWSRDYNGIGGYGEGKIGYMEKTTDSITVVKPTKNVINNETCPNPCPNPNLCSLDKSTTRLQPTDLLCKYQSNNGAYNVNLMFNDLQMYRNILKSIYDSGSLNDTTLMENIRKILCN